MNKYKIDITKPALKDLDYIIYYIVEELKEPGIAKKLYDKIINNINNLSEYPRIYAVIQNKNLKQFDYRKIVVDNYLIFYRVIDETNVVQVDRIMYGGMDWENLL